MQTIYSATTLTIDTFSFHEWFFCLWFVQEDFMARQLVFDCGKNTTSWSDLVRIAQGSCRLDDSIRSKCICPRPATHLSTMRTARTQLEIIFISKRRFLFPTLGAAEMFMDTFEYYEPLDKICDCPCLLSQCEWDLVTVEYSPWV